MMQSSRPLSVFPIGGAGAGKSTILNHLIGKPGHFLSSRSTESGVTKKISAYEGNAFNQLSKPLLKIFDAPGVGDHNIPLQ